jgi:hypothetical protein
MRNLVLMSCVLSSVLISGCVTTTTKESITRHPDVGTEATAGVGEVIYTYKKQGEVVRSLIDGSTMYATDSVKQEILYSGYSNGTLKSTYREKDYWGHAFTLRSDWGLVSPQCWRVVGQGPLFLGGKRARK